jgi:hypothetical protein
MSRKKLLKPVLAEGEATGHAHTLESDVDVFELENGIREFKLSQDTVLTHQEHNPITLPKGTYVSDKVIEYDHFTEEARQVQD